MKSEKCEACGSVENLTPVVCDDNIYICKKCKKESNKSLTYDEAFDLSFKVKWRTGLCNSGKECWCRTIETQTNIKYDGNNNFYIVGDGSLPKELANYIVKLHNRSLKLK